MLGVMCDDARYKKRVSLKIILKILKKKSTIRKNGITPYTILASNGIKHETTSNKLLRFSF